MNNAINAYSPAEIKGIQLNSRIIRSATHEGMSDSNGKPEEKLIKTFENYAKGGAGLIITGYIGISQQGKCPLYNMTMINDDSLIPPWQELVKRVHEAGAPIMA